MQQSWLAGSLVLLFGAWNAMLCGLVGVVSTLLGPEGTRESGVASNHRVRPEFKPATRSVWS